MIKSHVAGPATVAESVELTDLLTGEKREVDVCIESEAAGHKLVISIECRDHKRRQSVSWIDEMIGKHHTLPTDRLVLVSRSGFTRNAIRRTQLRNVEAIVPDELTEDQAVAIGARASQVRLGRIEANRIVKVTTLVDGVPEPITVPPEAGSIAVFTGDGRPIVSIRDIVASMVADQRAASEQILFNPPDGVNEITLRYDNPRIIINDGMPESLYMRMSEPAPPHLCRLQRVSVMFEGRHTSTVVAMHYGQLQSTAYSWGEVILAGKPTVVVSTTADDGSGIFSVRTRSFKPMAG